MSIFIIIGTMMVLGLIPFWYQRRVKLKKRVWRQVEVISLTKIKQHKTGPLELLGEPSLLAVYQYKDKEFTCQMAFRERLWNDFHLSGKAHILVDPTRPEQCFHNAEQAYRYAKWWLGFSFLLLVCQVILMI
ncbi:hypothetical protein ACFFK7_05820 [Pseudoalteromonas xiamenensis]|uniref:hypothetical protein n=1 Tax=Pseudoalteromonas xiamenensis TaxID=882626 RepID=UPI0035E8F0EB